MMAPLTHKHISAFLFNIIPFATIYKIIAARKPMRAKSKIINFVFGSISLQGMKSREHKYNAIIDMTKIIALLCK